MMAAISKSMDGIRLIRWLLSREYERTLSQVFREGTGEDLLGVLEASGQYFPFLNQAYFKGFQELKKDSQEIVGLQVQEVPMPDSILGAYLPETDGKPGTIFINRRMKPVFWLSTLAHELSHAVIYRYYKKSGAPLHETRLRHRISQFQEDLRDKEEAIADVLTAIGTYTQADLKRIFYSEEELQKRSKRFSFRDLRKAFKHLRAHYPEVTKNFLFTKDMFLNIAFIIHFLRLRMFVFDRFAI